MLELLQFVTSSLWVFIGSVVFTGVNLVCMGWGINAILLGLRGERCSPENLV